jgi:tripartite-type tricarboxylate transporter receptor subunit TctC
VAGGAVKAFGVSTGDPAAQLPGVASLVREYGPKLEVLFWHMMLAPAGTPRPIVNALNAALQDAVEDPEIAAAWAKSSVSAYPKAQRTPEAASDYLRKEIEHWSEVVRVNNIDAPKD